MKKRKIYFLIAGVFVLAAGGYYWYSKDSNSQKELEYITAPVEKGNLTSSISASGSVIVDNQSTVDPTITGTVADLAIVVGDKVEKDQFLFNIINDDLGVSVAKAAASYESAKNSLESAKIDQDDAEAKYEKAKDQDDDDGDAFTSEELDVLEDKIDLAESKVVHAEKNLAAAWSDYRNTQTDASKRKVTSSIAGTVLGVNVKNGDDLGRTSSVDNASAPIIIGDIETLKTEVEVNEVDIANVSIGQKVMLKLDALSGMDFSGQVEKIDSLGTVEQGVVSYKVTISFDTLDQRIKPDMSVSASIITDVKQNVVMVPSSAVKNDGNNNYVEVLNSGQPERKIVRTGASNNTSTEIISGVEVGDQVITQTIDPNVTAAQSSGNRNQNIRLPGVTGRRGFGG